MTRTGSVMIPVIVDSIKPPRRSLPGKRDLGDEIPLRRIVRCNYLSIECDSPKPDWRLNLGDETIPFMLLELGGIIHQPFGGGLFDTPEKIEDLFVRIEEIAGMYVNINDIWLPYILFDHRNMSPLQGGVYRVDSGLFNAAFLFREGRMGSETFIKQWGGSSNVEAIVLSEKETHAFMHWHEKQILLAKDHYPKKKELALDYRK